MYPKMYTKAGSTLLQKPQDTGQICSLNKKHALKVNHTSDKSTNVSFFTS